MLKTVDSSQNMLEETPPLLLAATLLLTVMAALVRGQCPCGPVKDGATEKIILGDEAGENDYPWMVRVVGATPLPGGCGGSLISRRHVLTAAHCIHPYSVKTWAESVDTRDKVIQNLRVIVGEHDLTKYINDPNWKTNEDWKDNVHKIIKISWHKDYWPNDEENGEFDYGIITLRNSVTFSDKVAPICFPVETVTVRYEGKPATFTGWGYDANNVTDDDLGASTIQSEVLKKLAFTVTPDQDMSRYI